MKRILGTIAAVAIVGSLVATRVNAQAHPSLTGTWVLDPSKTVFSGQGAAPDSAMRTVVQHGDTLTVDNVTWVSGAAQKTRFVYGIDGKPWKNTAMIAGEGTPVSTIVTWEGATLVMRSSLNFQGSEVIQVDRWSVAADGKTLAGTRTVTVEGAEFSTSSMTFIKKP